MTYGKLMLTMVTMTSVVALLVPLTDGAPLTLTLLPGPDIKGNAGSTVGFGYSIQNTSVFYYQPAALNAGVFSLGVPLNVFDFPLVDPGSAVTLPFTELVTSSCASPACGLFEVALKLSATVNARNSGTFLLSGE